MFDFHPENYRAQTADNEEKAGDTRKGQERAASAELLTRDHVARCIVREIKEGRGTPHGGVYLDISWIKQRIFELGGTHQTQAAELYHHFKQLGDIDITKEAMEVGPTTTTSWWGGWTRIPEVERTGLFAAGECAAGSTARSTVVAIRSPIFWSLGNGRRICGQICPKPIVRRNRRGRR